MWRAYVAATLPAFWSKYRQLAETDRHHYEILREGRPCHLYLDLEFKRKLNPGLDGDRVVDETVAAVRKVLARRWPENFGGGGGGVASLDDADVLELDSSSEEKFSRHVTIRLPGGVAFATNADAGAVVREAVYAAEDGGEGEDEEGKEEGEGKRGGRGEEGSGGESAAAAPETEAAPAAPAHAPAGAPSLASFARVVLSPEGTIGSAVDLGVYTRNRAWRMALSSKVDAPARILKPLARRYGGVVVGGDAENPSSSCPPPPPLPPATTKISDRAAFFCGLAGDVPPGFKLLSVEGAVYGGGGGPPGRRASSSLAVFAVGAGSAAALSSSHSSSSLRARPGPSPFPAVDAFIEGLATSLTGDGRQATVRSWAVAEDEGGQQQQQPSSSSSSNLSPTTTLVLSLRDGRYCGGVGRPHRSNGVYYVVDLRGGTFRQRCHDPECKGYRSPASPLPADVARAAALFALVSLGGVPPPPPSSSSSSSNNGGKKSVFEAIDDDEEATRRFLEAIDAAEAVALEERGERRRGSEEFENDDGDDNGDDEDGGDEALFAAVDAADAEAAAKRNSTTQEQ